MVVGGWMDDLEELDKTTDRKRDVNFVLERQKVA